MRSPSRTVLRLVLLPAWLAGTGTGSGAVLSISPGGSPTLQQAIEQAGPGDVIELANGTYVAPDGGFRITNAGKSFTIRSASGDPADVALDGQHLRPVLQLLNTDVSLGGVVRFEGLTFRNGSSELQGVAGGVTLQQAQAYFERCRFEGNRANVGGGGDTGGGGANISEGSRATLTECTFADNASGFYGGGLAVETGAQVSILASQFQGNRTNLPGHSPTAAGGGIHVGNAALFVRNTRFENNAAGFAGGGISPSGPGTRARRSRYATAPSSATGPSATARWCPTGHRS